MDSLASGRPSVYQLAALPAWNGACAALCVFQLFQKFPSLPQGHCEALTMDATGMGIDSGELVCRVCYPVSHLCLLEGKLNSLEGKL